MDFPRKTECSEGQHGDFEILRVNMASGILRQPGAWDVGSLAPPPVGEAECPDFMWKIEGSEGQRGLWQSPAIWRLEGLEL